MNKSCFENIDIILRGGKNMVTVKNKLVQLFRDHYINIVDRSYGIKPEKVELYIGSINKKGHLSFILD